MATKHLPIDDISDDDIEQDKTNFKKYYDDFSKDLTDHKQHYRSKMADNDLNMPNIDIPSLTENRIAPNTKATITDLNSNNARGNNNPSGKDETASLAKHKSNKKIDFNSNISENEKPDPNSIVSFSESRIDVDQKVDGEHKDTLQESKPLTTSNKENSRNFKSGFDSISKDTSLLLNPEKVTGSLNRDNSSDSHRILKPITKSQENIREDNGLSENLKHTIEKLPIVESADSDKMDELMKNLNGKLKSLKTTKSNKKKSKLRKASMNNKSKQNRQKEYPDLDEYNDYIGEYETIDETKTDNGGTNGNGSASLADSEAAVAKMAAIGRRPHGNNTVFEIREEGTDSVDIPASSGPWLAKIHGHRDIITAGCVVGGIGLLLILVSLVTIYFNRRKERGINKNNNRDYLQLGSAREKKHLNKEEEYSLFPITSSSEEDVFSDEEEDSFVNF